MNTRTSLLAVTVTAFLLICNTGCQSSNPATPAASAPTSVGPATGAAVLSSKKSFAIVGRTGSPITYTQPDGPEADVISQAVRTRLESLGYLFRSGSPDFVVSIAWEKYQKMEQPSEAANSTVTAPIVSVDKSTLSIAVRDSVSGTVLWQSPVSDPMSSETVTEDIARGLTAAALKDFPPAQPSSTASN